LRGAEANLSSAALHDGWAYFTPDAENFYIDADGKRIWVNQKASNMYISISTGMWQEKNGYWYANFLWSDLKTNINFSRYMVQLNLPSGLAEATPELNNSIIYAQPFIASNNETSLEIGAMRCPLGDIILAITLIPLENSVDSNGQIYTITYNLTGCTGPTDKKVIKHGDSLDITFTVTTGNSCSYTITMGNQTLTGAVIQGPSGWSTPRVVINQVTGNVVITLNGAS